MAEMCLPGDPPNKRKCKVPRGKKWRSAAMNLKSTKGKKYKLKSVDEEREKKTTKKPPIPKFGGA